MHKAFFLDRDGTLIQEKNYLASFLDIQLLENMASTLKQIKKKGFFLFVITNQSGIAKGFVSEDFVKQTHQKINTLLLDFGVSIDDFFYCPHHIKGSAPYNIECNCRKPKIGMVEQAKKKYDIDLKNSWVVGDKFTDIQLAYNLECSAALVLTGYGQKYKIQVKKLGWVKIIERLDDILEYI